MKSGLKSVKGEWAVEEILKGLYDSWPVVVTLIGCAVWGDRRFLRLERRAHHHEGADVVKLEEEDLF